MTLIADTVSLKRGGQTLIADLSFACDPGKALILRGPNGVGKSTLLRALCGFVPLESGSVRLGDVSLEDQDLWLSQIAYAGHLDALKPQLTVRENVTFWAGLFGGRAEDAIEAFNLGEIANRPVFTCSAGQKRRTGLARLALSKDRPLWLLDEPTVSLDTATVARVAAFLRGHLAAGGYALIATHIDLGLQADVVELERAERSIANEEDPFLSEGFA
ncbi:MAG: heme ABC exporter ATP-binding protein CcmA [Pseudomonadota bacterium]